jgi:hypothetical protein
MLALTSEGTVFAWGSNSVGATNVPSNLSNVTQISAGYFHSLAIGDLAKSDFTTGVTANIIGTPKVGSVLTASADDVDPGADSYTYRWFADDAEIDGATDDTFTPTAAQKDAAITVQVTAVKAGYNSSTDFSDPTDAVAAGTLDVTGSVTVTLVGSPQVGNTLVAESSVESTPAADLSGQWLRDGEVIADATGSAYDLTNADAGATITHEVTAVRAGYDDAKVTSNGIGPVDGGVITLPEPTVTGTPVVDGLLTASLPGTTLDPADAEVTYEWTRDGTYAGTGNTFTPNAGDAGEYLTVTATATKDYFDDATSDTDTEEVAPADFTTGPTATITGTLQVGETLTADEGDVAPSPEGYEYQWYADDAAVTDADGSTFTLTPAQNHAEMSVEVTATRPGYTPLSDTSTKTTGVVNDEAPTLDLDVAKPTLRRGQTTTLTWTSDAASSLVASGGWAGARAESGTTTISPRALGETSYILKATNDGGTTTAMVTVQVSRQAKGLRAWASNGLRMRGKQIRVAARGLDARESYVIRVAGTKVATGNAAASGKLSRLVTIPTGTSPGNARVTVTGSESDRTGRDNLRVVRNKTLGLRLAKTMIRASDDQRVTITGLARRERVTLTYQGKQISPRNARASKRGTYTRVFDVDIYWGTKSVKASGKYSGRSATKTFEVVRRCWTAPTCA